METASGVLARTINRKPIVWTDDGEIVINTGTYKYHFDLSQCDNYAKIVYWCAHLCEKTWCTPVMLHQFIMTACGAHNLNAYSDA